MKVIMGAAGRVGKSVVENLLLHNQKIRAVLRDPKKQSTFPEGKNISFTIADAFDLAALKMAFSGGDSVFLLTPETSTSEDMLSDVKQLVNNYNSAIRHSVVKTLVGLSSIGAQHETGTGNLSMAYQLEHGFDDLDVTRIFVRPCYYFSNWANSFALVKEQGVLPTFFPPELKIPMCSPADVGKLVADILTSGPDESETYELIGTEYSTLDIAEALSHVYDRSVTAQEIPKTAWWDTIKGFGASDDVAKNFIVMTEAVIDGLGVPEKKGLVIKIQSSFSEYLQVHQFA